MNPIYLSTGAFTGRVNGRDACLLREYAAAFRCDGFEWMIFPEFYGRFPALAKLYRGIPIPVVHADKRIGDYISADGDDAYREAERLLRLNAEAAQSVGARRLVTHGWGIPDSDLHPERCCERILRLREIARSYGQEMLVENCCCVHESPLAHLTALSERAPDMRFVVDTRPAEFHRELRQTTESELFRKNIAHLHINDYMGGYKQWDALYPIPQPGRGQIDFDSFFRALRAIRYQGSLTLEAPSMRERGVDADTLNASLDFIREQLKEDKHHAECAR